MTGSRWVALSLGSLACGGAPDGDAQGPGDLGGDERSCSWPTEGVGGADTVTVRWASAEATRLTLISYGSDCGAVLERACAGTLTQADTVDQVWFDVTAETEDPSGAALTLSLADLTEGYRCLGVSLSSPERNLGTILADPSGPSADPATLWFDEG